LFIFVCVFSEEEWRVESLDKTREDKTTRQEKTGQ